MLKIPGNIICASLFTGVYDVNRNELLPDDNLQLIEKWCQSIKNLDLKGIIFHNSFSDKTISEVNPGYIRFIKVDFDAILNPNVYRYLVYFEFLKKIWRSDSARFFSPILRMWR